MEIVLKKGIDPDAWKHVAGWSEQVFPAEGNGMEWAPLRWHVMAIEAGMPVAHIGFDRFSVSVGAETRSVVGVGGVVVRPEFQKKGLPAQLFEKVHSQCPDDIRSDTFALFCPERFAPYYKRHGYEKVEGNITIRQRGKRTTTDQFVLMVRGRPFQSREIILSSPPW